MEQPQFKYDETVRQIIYKNLSMSIAICIKQKCNIPLTRTWIQTILNHMVNGSIPDHNVISERLNRELDEIEKTINLNK